MSKLKQIKELNKKLIALSENPEVNEKEIALIVIMIAELVKVITGDKIDAGIDKVTAWIQSRFVDGK